MSSLSITDPAQGVSAPREGADAPIGVFDSGLGGLTVLRELMHALPHESFIFLGDSARCPYGPRRPEEVRGFVLEICRFLMDFGCKMIVIACNTATAAGLADAQRAFDVPVVGVVEPGARAAVHMTRARRVGVIATEGTIGQGAYEDAIAHLDAGIQVHSQATPEFVRIAEARFAPCDAQQDEKELRIAEEYLLPIKAQEVDALVLGCTHYPLIADLIAQVMGEGVALVSSAEETAREVRAILERRGQLADAPGGDGLRVFVTGDDTEKFAMTAQGLLGRAVRAERVSLQG